MPEVIALDISEFELPHLILTFMDGKPSRDSIAAHDGGAWLRRVHSMELPGWGPLGDRARPGPSRGRHSVIARGHIQSAVRTPPAGGGRGHR